MEEARRYQTLTGGTVNIIPKQDELTTVEIVEPYPNMDDNKYLDTYTHRLLQESMYYTTDGLEYVKRISGSNRMNYKEDQITDESLLDSKLNILHARNVETSNLLNEIQKKGNYTRNYKKLIMDTIKWYLVWTHRYKLQPQGTRQHRASILKAIEKIRIESGWTRKYIKHVDKADKPSDFKTYKGRVLNSDDGSSDDEVLSEVSDFSYDDALFEDTLTFEKQAKTYTELLNGPLESISQ